LTWAGHDAGKSETRKSPRLWVFHKSRSETSHVPCLLDVWAFGAPSSPILRPKKKIIVKKVY
jgi:hypothetical protein